jgi:hypothetical protein
MIMNLGNLEFPETVMNVSVVTIDYTGHGLFKTAFIFLPNLAAVTGCELDI